MPHSCVHCSQLYDDGSEEVLKGCSKCGGKFFFYISRERYERLLEGKEKEEFDEIDLSSSEKKKIESDVRDMAGIDEDDDTPVVLDFESVKVLKQGKYLIDVNNLFTRERPLIYKLEDGKYIIDITSQFRKSKKV